MIIHAEVYQRVNQILKSGTSGYQSDTEWNSDAKSTFLAILDILCDNYEANEKVSDLLNKEGLIVSEDLTTDAAGVFTFAEDHYRSFPLMVYKMVSSVRKEYPVDKLATNEVAMHETSPIRGFDAAKNAYGYYMTNKGYQMLPRATTTLNRTYCIQPDMPVLVLTNDDDDFTVVGEGTTDIQLPENLFNLFCYEMVFRCAIEMREQMALQIASEYMRIGIKTQ